LIGDAAKNQVAMNPVNTYVISPFLSARSLLIVLSSVFDAKRLIGRKYDDAEVQSDIKHFPFKVLNKAGKPYVRVSYRGEDKEFVRLFL
jgi:molecular chaperone DnaK (HSP70)